MKILQIGTSGTIGKAVYKVLSKEHQVITANHSSDCDVTIDLSKHESIKAMFEAIGKIDAIVCTAGNGQLLPLHQHKDEDYVSVLHNKLMGQVNLLRYGASYLNEGGSVTLTSGRAHRDVIPGTSSIAMATAALEGFVKAASVELEGIRLNVVSPAVVKESLALLGFDMPGAVSAEDTAKAYVSAVNGEQNGLIIQSSDFAL